MIKKILLTGLAVAMMVFANVEASQANPIAAGDKIQLTGYNPVDNAGVMTFRVNGTFTLDTFCIQDNVSIDWNVNTIAGLSDHVGLGANAVQLNLAVDYLFYRYASGAYKNDMTSNVAVADLQRLLWNLQRPDAHYTQDNILQEWDVDYAAFTSNVALQHSYGTKVINIMNASGANLQNQLYNPVPEPAAMILFGAGLVGLTAVVRKKRS